MQGLLVLGSRPDVLSGKMQIRNFKILYENAADYAYPPLFLSHAQLLLSRLMTQCRRVCVWAEGDAAACALVLAAQLDVDRLILIGDGPFIKRHPDFRQRRFNAFVRRNLSLITSEIIAADMSAAACRQLSSSLNWHSCLVCFADGAELWQKSETFLTAPFEALSAPLDP